MTISITPKFMVRALVEETEVFFDYADLAAARIKAAALLATYPGEQVEVYQLMEVDYTEVSEVKIASLLGEP